MTSVLIGTTKGAFILDDVDAAGGYNLRGPFCDGWPINHVVGDGTGHVWAAGGGDWHGAGVWHSPDNGDTWNLYKFSGGDLDKWAREDAEFATMIGYVPMDLPFDGEIVNLWSLCICGDRIFAGAKPATLYVSEDKGASWSKVSSLTDHPSAEEWQPGGAGLTLHTIVTDPRAPQKLWIAISVAGVFASEDGGTTWERRNKLSNGEFAAADNSDPASPRNGEIGHCVHNMVRARRDDHDILYQQNHEGVFRSRDGGRIWDDISDGLPTRFGFPISVHPEDPETIWTLPLNGDSLGRYPPDAVAAVWKSTDAGETWAAKRAGLPQSGCFFTVLRQAMATGPDAASGAFFGTNTGSLFASFDGAETWAEIARHLPTVLSVEALPDHSFSRST